MTFERIKDEQLIAKKDEHLNEQQQWERKKITNHKIESFIQIINLAVVE